jgi:hypothetical protein
LTLRYPVAVVPIRGSNMTFHLRDVTKAEADPHEAVVASEKLKSADEAGGLRDRILEECRVYREWSAAAASAAAGSDDPVTDPSKLQALKDRFNTAHSGHGIALGRGNGFANAVTPLLKALRAANASDEIVGESVAAVLAAKGDGSAVVRTHTVLNCFCHISCACCPEDDPDVLMVFNRSLSAM